MFQGFHHVGSEVWYSRNQEGDQIICDDTGEDEDCHEGEDIEFSFWDLFDVVDYFWDNYIEDHAVYIG